MFKKNLLFLASVLLINNVYGQAANTGNVNGMMYYEGTQCGGSIIKVNADKQGRPVVSGDGKCTVWGNKFSSKSSDFNVKQLKGTFAVDEGDITIRYFYKANTCVPEGIVSGGLIARCDGEKVSFESYDDFECKIKSSYQKPVGKGLVCKTFDGSGGESLGSSSSATSLSVTASFYFLAFLLFLF